MRIAFLSARNINDVSSSAHYYMFRQLSRFATVEHIPLFPERSIISRLSSRLWSPQKVLSIEFKAAQRLQLYSHIHRKLGGKQHDVVFAPMGSEVVALLETDIPIVYASDATFALLLNYYDKGKGLPIAKQLRGHAVEQAAIANATHITYPSRWAAESAQVNYGAEPSKISIIPYGANLSQELISAAANTHGIEHHPLRLIFIASKWERKGGALAIEIFRHLRKIYKDCELHVCGDKPPAKYGAEPGLVHHGFLNKNKSSKAKRYVELLACGTVMLFPTEADCSPHIINEAYAMGLPVIARRTGGVAELVVDGETGALLPEDAGAVDYVNRILEIVNNDDYYAMKANAVSLYGKSLNWNSWGNAIWEAISGPSGKSVGNSHASR